MRREVIPKMRDSAITLVIGPDFAGSQFDVDFAVQIGASVLLEKPLLVVVPKGRVLPPKLVTIADRIIEMTDDDAATGEAIRQFMTDFARQ
jgi:hypothetical protein